VSFKPLKALLKAVADGLADSEPKMVINAAISRQTFSALQAIALRRSVSMQAVIRLAIAAYLDQQQRQTRW
jgi:hypothetical protein